MIKQTHFNMTTINTASLAKASLIGGGIALLLISLLVFGTETNPAWPSYWRIRPLIMTTLSGAAGGAVFYFMNTWFPQTGWKKITLNILCLLIAVFGLWIGTVLGLDGTLWN
jgi:hypothetical protein